MGPPCSAPCDTPGTRRGVCRGCAMDMPCMRRVGRVACMQRTRAVAVVEAPPAARWQACQPTEAAPIPSAGATARSRVVSRPRPGQPSRQPRAPSAEGSRAARARCSPHRPALPPPRRSCAASVALPPRLAARPRPRRRPSRQPRRPRAVASRRRPAACRRCSGCSVHRGPSLARSGRLHQVRGPR